jgi:hypothetical protein
LSVRPRGYSNLLRRALILSVASTCTNNDNTLLLVHHEHSPYPARP